ncbi:TetR/AcrR family transcriptional regulator [Rhodococcus sp. NPDC003348]
MASSGRPAAPEQRIADAVLDLLRLKGPRAVTIEGVATRTGMARTTIYRRYRDRDEMLTAALAPIAQPVPPAADATARDVLVWLTEQSLRSIDSGIGFGGLAALVTDEDPSFTHVIRAILVRHRGSLAGVVREHIARGTVRADLDADTFMDSVVGAYVAHRARGAEDEAGIVDRVVDTLLPAFARTPTGGR